MLILHCRLFHLYRVDTPEIHYALFNVCFVRFYVHVKMQLVTIAAAQLFLYFDVILSVIIELGLYLIYSVVTHVELGHCPAF